MSADNWERLQHLYHEAIDLAPEARAGFVVEACGADTTLQRHLASLLDAATHDDAFLRAPVRRAQQEAAHAPGEVIGPYRLVRELGAGGMGVAFLAERDDEQFRKQVALKVMRFGIADAHLRARFRAERQILATLEHPNIARLLDGGETADGAPYIVMEYVAGERVTDYAARLPIRARLALLLKVCGAVRYAHASLVVHRDIKPSNLLVTEAGEPKLLDFGVAKILQPELAMVDTQTGQAAFTPRYASPEQMRGQAATTACDVYALGVVLYEVLTGAVPFPETNIADLAVAIEHRDPPPPRIDAELDAVVLKAIHRDPAQRYASVEALTHDLERYLGGYPVDARRATWGYRARKFAGRNRLAVGLAALFIVSVVGFGTGMGVLARRAERERDTAQEVAAFLGQIFRASNPINSRGRELTASELLAQGAVRVEQELAGQPEVQGELLTHIGNTYRDMGRNEQAREIYDKALAIRRRQFGDTSVQVAGTLQSLGQLYTDSGDYGNGETTLLECLRIQRTTLGEEHYDTANTRNILGLTYYYQGRLREAEAMLMPALPVVERLAGERDRLYGVVLNNLAIVRRQQGNVREAERLFRERLRVSRAAQGDGSEAVAVALTNLGAILIAQERCQEAEAPLRDALATHSVLYPEGSLWVANNTLWLGVTLGCLDRLEEAEPFWQELLALRPRVTGERSMLAATDRAQYAAFLLRRGLPEQAERTARDALQILREVAPENAHNLASALTSHGRTLLALGRFGEAEAAIREALALREANNGPENPFTTAGSLIDLGLVLRAAGRDAEADSLLEKALRIRVGALAADDPLVLAARRARIEGRHPQRAPALLYSSWPGHTHLPKIPSRTWEDRPPFHA